MRMKCFKLIDIYILKITSTYKRSRKLISLNKNKLIGTKNFIFLFNNLPKLALLFI